MAGEAVGFWSYVQQDNDGDYGRILALAADLREQYRAQTAEKLELFVDRESIRWGEAWKERIDRAIARATFFIAIVTPSYFRSPQCRHELLEFERKAGRLSLGNRLLVVYWRTVPELGGDPAKSADEAIRLVAKYKWEDLRRERLEERGSSAYRQAVEKLAVELVKRVGLAGQLDEARGGTRTIERLVAAEGAMPRAVALLEKIRKHVVGIAEKTERADVYPEVAYRRSPGARLVLTLTDRLAQDLAEPAAICSNGHEYAWTLAELAATQAREALAGLLDQVEPVTSPLSRSLRAPLDAMRGGLRKVLDSNCGSSANGRNAPADPGRGAE